jgi:hypothetical protein
MNKVILPEPDELFGKYFDQWYDDVWRRWKGFKGTRPDIQNFQSYRGKQASEVSPLGEDGQAEAARMVSAMFNSAVLDWPSFLKLSEPVGLNWVDEWDRFHNRIEIQSILDNANPTDFSNGYVISCCQFGAVLGEVLREQNGQLEWLYAWPYWESSLLHGESGLVINVFHWAIKKMSEYGVDDGYAAKVKACCDLLRKYTPT